MTRLKKIKGAIFDLDGTLLDSMDVWREIDILFLSKRGIPFSEEYGNAVKNMHFPQAAQYTIEKYGFQDTPESIMSEWLDLARETYQTRIELKPYAKEYLFALKERGVKLGVATSSRVELYRSALLKSGVFSLFTSFVHTEEVSRGKDFPDIYLETAKRINVAPCECAVYEDLLTGIKSAKDGGFITVGVYDSHSEREQAELEAASDIYIKSFSELL